MKNLTLVFIYAALAGYANASVNWSNDVYGHTATLTIAEDTYMQDYWGNWTLEETYIFTDECGQFEDVIGFPGLLITYRLVSVQYTRNATPTLAPVPTNAFALGYATPTRADVENKCRIGLGVTTLLDDEKDLLDAGCIGIAYLMTSRRLLGHNHQIIIGHPTPDPESNDIVTIQDFGEARAYLSLTTLESRAPSCGSGHREVVFIKEAEAWKNGTQPTPHLVTKEVPIDSLDPSMNSNGHEIINYITRIGTKWYGASHAIGTSSNPQVFYEITGDPGPSPHPSYGKRLYIHRCVPN